ncbi:MAG: 16S rRNA (guanine(966)-N(2))-methyltransferase RsmD [Negativicutes bacterium]|jgi:16S rRNA (guanine(966)-N(2))-methyltransferase RsmD
MRIVAGMNKGMVLKTTKGSRVRPTADRVKESLFNILSVKILDAKVLDLFSGTGNLALEALSRGAYSACLVDNHAESIAVINENIGKTRSVARIRIIKNDCLSAIMLLGRATEKFDVIFCDPPYNCDWLKKIVVCVESAKLLAIDGVLIVEHNIDEKYVESIGMKLIQSRRYGSTVISFFKEDVNANSGMSGEF